MKIDIEEVVNSKLKAMKEEKIVEKALEETIEKTVVNAITNALDSYYIRNQIEEKFEKEISKVLEQTDFSSYNGFIANKIKQIIEQICQKDIEEKIQKTFEQIFVNKRESIDLSYIFEQYRDYLCDVVDESEKYDLENFYVSMEDSESPYHWIRIKLGKEKCDKHYSYCNQQIEFTIHKTLDRKIGKIGTLYINGHSINESINFGAMSDIEKLLVNLAYNRTPINIDVENIDDIDTSFDID